MSEATIRELRQLLAAQERDVGFLDYLPATAVDPLAHRVREALDSHAQQLSEAIEQGPERLPVGLGGIVRSILS